MRYTQKENAVIDRDDKVLHGVAPLIYRLVHYKLLVEKQTA